MIRSDPVCAYEMMTIGTKMELLESKNSRLFLSLCCIEMYQMPDDRKITG